MICLEMFLINNIYNSHNSTARIQLSSYWFSKAEYADAFNYE